MKSQCPLCYSPLEVRDVAPCYVCGGWPDAVARFDPAARFAEYRLPGGQTLVLCRGCELEEFMVPGGWGFRLITEQTRPINALQLVRMVDRPELARDKFCPSCNLRLAFADVIADTQGDTSPNA
jgi:hypothetical protein